MENLMDFHDLINSFGKRQVCDALHITERALVDLRRGHTALTVDDLFELSRNFPMFDMGRTVRRLGSLRVEKRKSRKFKVSRAT